MKKVIKPMLMALTIVLFISACKEETPKPADNNNNGGGGGNTEQYILFNGIRMANKNPKPAEIRKTGDDTTLFWIANTHSTLNGDSFLTIYHNNNIVKRGVNTIDDGSAAVGDVEISIVHGQTSSATSVRITSGDFKLEKVNGIWYSVLKNGAGEGKKGSTTKNFTGVEFRVAWPSTFK